MKTDDLNDYIFGELLYRHAQIARGKRQTRMQQSGSSSEEIFATSVNHSDCQAAYDSINHYRDTALKFGIEASY